IQTYDDLAGNINSITDESKHSATIAYDKMNRPTDRTVPYADGVTLKWHNDYDAAGNLVRMTDSNTHVTTFAYDPINRVSERVDGAGDLDLTTTWSYDEKQTLGFAFPVPVEDFGFYVFQRDPANFVSLRVSNKDGQVTHQIDAI